MVERAKSIPLEPPFAAINDKIFLANWSPILLAI